MAGCFSKPLISVALAGYEKIIANEARNLALRCQSTTGRKRATWWNGQSAPGPMCDAEKDWHESSSAFPVQIMAAKNLLSTNRKWNFLSLFLSHE